MAQSQHGDLNMSVGRTTGNVEFCTSCGGHVERIDGTDPERTDALGGFTETFECESCGLTGTYRYRYRDAKETFTGCLAGSHRWE